MLYYQRKKNCMGHMPHAEPSWVRPCEITNILEHKIKGYFYLGKLNDRLYKWLKYLKFQWKNPTEP